MRSRFLTEAEGRYAPIELEMLAITLAVRKCDLYVRGLTHFLIVMDHKPLLPFLNLYMLDQIANPRLQLLREKLLPYNFTADWRQGKAHLIPDALSRAPVSQPEKTDNMLDLSLIHI